MNFREYLFYNRIQVKDVAEVIDIRPGYLSAMLNGKKIWSRKVSKSIQWYTQGVIKASDLEGKWQNEIEAIQYKDKEGIRR